MPQTRAENERRARAPRRRAGASRAGASRASRANGARPEQGAQKGKGPALAGGAAAAAAAVAGGIALARNSKKGKGRVRGRVSLPHLSAPHVARPHLPKPSNGETKDALRAAAKALGEVAVEVGRTGYRVGELTSEVRRVREQASRRG